MGKAKIGNVKGTAKKAAEGKDRMGKVEAQPKFHPLKLHRVYGEILP